MLSYRGVQRHWGIEKQYDRSYAGGRRCAAPTMTKVSRSTKSWKRIATSDGADA